MLVLLAVSVLYAGVGLNVTFSTIVLEKVEPGSVLNITKLRKIPFHVHNVSTNERGVKVEVRVPNLKSVKQGYEPIPDPAWLRTIPDSFRLKPGQKMSCEVVLAVPNDVSLVGRHFEAIIAAKTVLETGDYFASAVTNRFYFSVGTEGPEAVKRAKAKQILMSVNFDVEPEEMYLEVPLGKKVDVLKTLSKGIKLVNKGGTNLVVKLQSVQNDRGFPVTESYEFTPEPGLLSFKPKEIRIGKNQIKDTRMVLNIPADEKYRNKKYMFLVQTIPIKPQMPFELYTKVMVTIQ